MENIYLVGFMGTGKSTVGRKLARDVGLRFIDLDSLIRQKEKRSINDIFLQSGEPYFRKIEKETLKKVSLAKGQVIACGGGIVIDLDNIALMKKTGRLLALSATPEVILKRTQKYSHRPLLNVEDPHRKINELLKARLPYYSQAEFLIDTSDLSVKQVAEKIKALLNLSKKR